MKRPGALWYTAIALLLLAPVGWRILSWTRPEVTELDPASVQAGQELFMHVWTPNDPLAKGDGLGPVFNASSCVACHAKPIAGGSSGREHNVTNFVVQGASGKVMQEGVVHSFAVREEFQETLRHVHSQLPPRARPELTSLVTINKRLPGRGLVVVKHDNRDLIPLPPGVHLSQRNTPALFGARLIDAIPDHVILAEERMQKLRHLSSSDNARIPVGRAAHLPGNRVGKFGWKGQSGSLLDFVQAACANELGLGNPAHPQPSPLGQPKFQTVALDLTTEQCLQMRDFIASLPAPKQQLPRDPRLQERITQGETLFKQIGCAACHTPNMGSVEGIYSDLLLHRMGQDLTGMGSYHGNVPERSPGSDDEWRTPPLWGVADSGPYLHDGRAATLEEAIQMHAGQSEASAQRFSELTQDNRQKVLEFLMSLRAP
jgi:CxxC motif-containing protein (DUF1111 family)